MLEIKGNCGISIFIDFVPILTVSNVDGNAFCVRSVAITLINEGIETLPVCTQETAKRSIANDW